MMVKRYRVRLAEEEQEELMALVSKGRAAAYKQTHARILLLCDENQADGAMKDEEIAQALKVGTATVERVRRRCVEEGLEAALGRRQQLNRRQRKLDGAGEARLITLACSQPMGSTSHCLPPGIWDSFAFPSDRPPEMRPKASVDSYHCVLTALQYCLDGLSGSKDFSYEICRFLFHQYSLLITLPLTRPTSRSFAIDGP